MKERLVSALREWQQIERDAIDQAAEVMERSSNPLIRELMDIIRTDSVQHFRVQQFLIDTLVENPVSVTPEEIDEVWDAIVRHEKIEKSVVAVAAELRRESTDFVQRTLLDYLLQDEKKHDRMLETLEDYRRNLYPYD